MQSSTGRQRQRIGDKDWLKSNFFSTLVIMKIVFYGDSMTEYLHDSLRAFRQHFDPVGQRSDLELLNYGVGATRAELVLYRMLYEFWHGRKRMLPLATLQPDVIVMESCAFNNSTDREDGFINFEHIWDQIVSTCRQFAPRAATLIYITIPPDLIIPEEKANRLFFRSLPEIFAYRHHWRQVYQDRFAQWAQSRQIDILDIRRDVFAMERKGMLHRDLIHADGVHPNAAGVDLISRRLAEEITARLGNQGNSDG